MVGLRDRPAADRQVRRRAGGRNRNAPAPRLHRRRRLPHPQPESGPGHERLDAGRLQSRMEARRRPAPAQRAASPAQLLGGTAGGGEGADRLRPRMGRDPRLRQGRQQGRGRRRNPKLFRPARPLYRGNGDALPPVPPHRRAGPPASRQGLCDRHALSLRAGHSARGRQAGSSWPRRQGGRTLPDFRLCRQRRSRRLELPCSRAVRLPERESQISGQKVHARGRRYRFSDRCPRGVPASASGARHRGDAPAPAPAERTLRT